MKTLILLLGILSCQLLSAHDTIGVYHKVHKYYYTDSCYVLFDWDSVVLKNKKVEALMNSNALNVVSKIMNGGDCISYTNSDGVEVYIRDGDEEDKSIVPGDETDEMGNGRNADTIPISCDRYRFGTFISYAVAYSQHNLLSYVRYESVYCGGAHPYHYIDLLNYDAKTGKLFSFSDLIDTSQMAAIDTLIMRTFAAQNDEDIYNNVSWDEQLPLLQFAFGDTALGITLKGISYVNSYVGVGLRYEELKPFASKKSLLNRFYKNNGHRRKRK